MSQTAETLNLDQDIFNKVIEIVTPFAKNKDALNNVSADKSFVKDLQVSSSRLVDIILAIEDQFNIEVGDDEADKVHTVGAAVTLIQNKIGK